MPRFGLDLLSAVLSALRLLSARQMLACHLFNALQRGFAMAFDLRRLRLPSGVWLVKVLDG